MPNYAGKICLAPMVRSGELPTRLMALKYGADLVWSPEYIDKKIKDCTRVENKASGTIDYVDSGRGSKSTVIFRTKRSVEEGKLIFQLGSADPELAVAAAANVIHDVDGIDLNCGCPKPFSTHAGMGAALLSTPDLLTSILKNLVEKVGKPNEKPISAKIRLLDSKDPQPTLDLVEKICQTGVSNVTVHCRTREMRNRDVPIRDFVSKIYSVVEEHNVSLVINGGFRCRKEFQEFQHSIGNFKVGGMIAEAAESNPTVFSESPSPWKVVLKEFIETCISCDNNPANSKYILLNQIPGKSKYYQLLCKVKNNQEYLKIAESIDDDGDKIFVRVMQKDKQYETEEFNKLFICEDADDTESPILTKKRKVAEA